MRFCDARTLQWVVNIQWPTTLPVRSSSLNVSDIVLTAAFSASDRHSSTSCDLLATFRQPGRLLLTCCCLSDCHCVSLYLTVCDGCHCVATAWEFVYCHALRYNQDNDGLTPMLPHQVPSADVESLYTNMHRSDNIINKTNILTKPRPLPSGWGNTGTLGTHGTHTKNNDFEFGGQFFPQICGIAMGHRYDLSAANIYLRQFDYMAMNNFHIKPILYSRFLDDIFGIWPGTIQELNQYEEFTSPVVCQNLIAFCWDWQSKRCCSTAKVRKYVSVWVVMNDLLSSVYTTISLVTLPHLPLHSQDVMKLLIVKTCHL